MVKAVAGRPGPYCLGRLIPRHWARQFLISEIKPSTGSAVCDFDLSRTQVTDIEPLGLAA